MSFQRFLVPVYYWKTVEIMITGVNYSEIGSTFNQYINVNFKMHHIRTSFLTLYKLPSILHLKMHDFKFFS